MPFESLAAVDDVAWHGQVHVPQFPRAARYPAGWQMENAMGPNPLWLVDSLTSLMRLEPGMRVLDLGCGRAVTSIFLAEEYDVQVVAGELWMTPELLAEIVRDAGATDRVLPMRLDGRHIPFAEGYFDAIVSIDALHYFGTDQLYLPELIKYLRPGGQLGVVVPAVTREIEEVPQAYADVWQPDMFAWHSPQWWRQLWERSGTVDVEHADLLPDGFDHWLRWEELTAARQPDDHFSAGWSAAMRRDEERRLGFTRLVATRHAAD